MNFKVVFIIVSLEQKANLKNFRVKFMLFRKYSMGQCYKIQILQFFNRCRMFLNYSLIITSRNVDWQQQFFLLRFSLKMILKVTQFFSNCYSIRCYFYLHCWFLLKKNIVGALSFLTFLSQRSSPWLLNVNTSLKFQTKAKGK